MKLSWALFIVSLLSINKKLDYNTELQASLELYNENGWYLCNDSGTFKNGVNVLDYGTFEYFRGIGFEFLFNSDRIVKRIVRNKNLTDISCILADKEYFCYGKKSL